MTGRLMAKARIPLSRLRVKPVACGERMPNPG